MIYGNGSIELMNKAKSKFKNGILFEFNYFDTLIEFMRHAVQNSNHQKIFFLLSSPGSI